MSLSLNDFLDAFVDVRCQCDSSRIPPFFSTHIGEITRLRDETVDRIAHWMPLNNLLSLPSKIPDSEGKQALQQACVRRYVAEQLKLPPIIEVEVQGSFLVHYCNAASHH